MLSYNAIKKMEKEKKNMPELLTLKEACEILRCHPNTLRQWDKKGILVAVRFGERKDRRYRQEDIENFIKYKKISR
jgi:excisionase family DNA binding protein